MAITDQTKTWLAQYNLLPARKTAERTLFLYFAMIINLLMGFVVTKLNSAWLDINEFGIYSFLINSILFTRVALSFGLFESGARLLATSKETEELSPVSGVIILFTLSFGLILNGFIFIYSYFFDSIFEIHIAGLLAYFSPIVFVLMFQAMYNALLRGLGKIKLLGFFTITPRFLYVISISILYYFDVFSLKSSIAAYFITLLVIVIIFLPTLNPVFSNLKSAFNRVTGELKSYGRHIYVANIMTALFQHSDKIFLAYFVNEQQLAYYALAFALTFPLAHFPNALGNASFKNYANQRQLNKRHIQATVVYTVASTIILILLRNFIIIDLFGERFEPAIISFVVLTIAFAINGISIPYTLFFKAQKLGKTVRNITFIAQSVYVILNVLLIPFFGIIGAALAALVAFSLDLTMYILYYNKRFQSFK
ncbi:MAG: oligosaccharide flippase family protein [Calditrichae bacterium]|nr:oligosaccharide flippase family protein [Calditrichota bacterium]MCB9058719.1 oligosaccharide flippase family protein [Calditrichia bacterium]